MNFWLSSTCLFIRFFVSIRLALYDRRHQRLPNGWNAILFLCNLDTLYLHQQANTLLPWLINQGLFYVCIVLPLFLISWFGYRREVMLLGLGDIKLIAALTPWLGDRLPWMLLFASLGAAGVLLLRRQRSLPFGPFLLSASWLVHCFAQAKAWP